MSQPARPMGPGPARREIRSYARRGSRLSPTQAAAWRDHHERWVIPPDALADTPFSQAAWFGREAPLVVEIGSGVGEATVALAAARPTYDVLALEVWIPGVASTLARLAEQQVANVRLSPTDAAWALTHLFGPAALAELWTFFPDPWPKARHHKRRLVNAELAALAASRLAPGALWRLATDWGDYAEQMVAVLDAQPRLVGGVTQRWRERPETRFERKGHAAGRRVVDLCYRRLG